MGKRSEFLIYILTILLLFVFAPINPVFAVPAVPNESIVVGRVVECTVTSSSMLNIKPDQTIYSMTLEVESSEGVNKGPDFLDDKKGEYIRFFSKDKLSRKLFGERVKAIVSFKGDERGGRFWAGRIEVIK